MKKFFSLIALVGVFAACQKEDLKTAFTVEPAVATITAHAMFLDGTPLTSNVTYTFNGVDNGSTPTFDLVGNPDLRNQIVNVTATFNGFESECNIPGYTVKPDTKSGTVEDINVLAGGKGKYDIYFTLGQITDDEGYTYWTTEEVGDTETKAFFLDKAMHEGHEFTDPETGATGWFLKNATEFILRGTVNYEVWTGSEPATEISWGTKTTLPWFQSQYDALKVEKTPETLDIVVSAWADYVVYQTLDATWVDVTLWRTDLNGIDEEIANYSRVDYTSSIAGFNERAAEGHEAHYVEGHGHDDPAHSHGHGSSNAGGGIVMAD